VGVVARIHWQAVRLAFRKAPFYGKHPAPGRNADASTDPAAAAPSSAAAQPVSSD
jgi:DUF1365 family protein